jgi:hypothetical protein
MSFQRIESMALQAGHARTGGTIYDVNRKGRLPWLQKKLLAVLDWLGSSSPEYQEKIEVVQLNFDPTKVYLFASELVRQASCFELMAGTQEFCVVIGRKQLVELSLEAERAGILERTVRPTLIAQTICGMDVIVVPWIEGAFVLPKQQRGYRIDFG